MSTFGPTYKEGIDGDRLRHQMERIRMLMVEAGIMGKWLSLAEIELFTGYPQASISAQLRHLRKEAFGGHIVRKRRREPAYRGVWEYHVKARPIQLKLMFEASDEKSCSADARQPQTDF